MSSWMSCLYCSLFSAQLWSRLLSRCCPNNGGGAVNVFQSSLKGIFVDDCSRYLASRLFGKFKLKGGGEICLLMVLMVVIMFLVVMRMLLYP